MTDSLLTAADVARILNLNTETVYRLVSQEGLPASKIGGQWRFQRPKVLAWVDAQASDIHANGTAKKSVRK